MTLLAVTQRNAQFATAVKHLATTLNRKLNVAVDCESGKESTGACSHTCPELYFLTMHRRSPCAHPRRSILPANTRHLQAPKGYNCLQSAQQTATLCVMPEFWMLQKNAITTEFKETLKSLRSVRFTVKIPIQ